MVPRWVVVIRGKTIPPVIVVAVMLPLVAEISTPVLLDNVGVPAAVVANDPAVTTSVVLLYVNPASPPNVDPPSLN